MWYKMSKKSEAGSTPAVVGGDLFVSPSSIDAIDINTVIDNPFDLPLLTDYLGSSKSKDALLTGCSVDNGKYGDFVLLDVSNNGSDPVKYRSGGTAIVSQVGKILASGLDIKKGIIVHIVKKSAEAGDYLSLLG